MKELFRTNNAVYLSFAQAVLKDAGIETLLFDDAGDAECEKHQTAFGGPQFQIGTVACVLNGGFGK